MRDNKPYCKNDYFQYVSLKVINQYTKYSDSLESILVILFKDETNAFGLLIIKNLNYLAMTKAFPLKKKKTKMF